MLPAGCLGTGCRNAPIGIRLSPHPFLRGQRPCPIHPPRDVSASWPPAAAPCSGVALLSGLINILYLSGSLFMMEVYDRVLPSRSIPTLVGLSVIIVVLYLFQGLFDMLRGRIFARVGAAVDEDLSQRVFQRQLSAPLRDEPRATGSSRCAISTRSAPFSPAAGRRRCSTCRGCRSISSSALPSIPARLGHVGRCLRSRRHHRR